MHECKACSGCRHSFEHAKRRQGHEAVCPGLGAPPTGEENVESQHRLFLRNVSGSHQPRHVVGRLREQQLLNARLQKKAPGLQIVSGDVGSGKSHVVRFLVHQLCRRNPNIAVAFVDAFSLAPVAEIHVQLGVQLLGQAYPAG